jgi:hypothetical protein
VTDNNEPEEQAASSAKKFDPKTAFIAAGLIVALVLLIAFNMN